ncbi:MAG TPA: hydrogenase maturation nickel metallochaperone HypA [Spirochaetota bacterium]|nr:hydrogenase maturation nickel metallochaperone HypA [Spirochaetota bacterium]HPF08015.1 hydrogenase maturation nickel metallochaperone HypA [Spirochaetota bacterium]HPJ44186.1 hydrogenase maturation nickel metallochaperone HypA [Spirochaetota bacterium]HPR37397.1 hydrogenase maturation nickel metallochaperone HypA [Spirochaetota bacterium]HRX46386.1 hydrogenase maturation nickel metallochaperone HypA [Spirochaetota bacterium]
MHELSLAMSVRDIVEEAAKSNGSAKVNEVNIVVGSFSSVVPDALEFAMEVAKKGTVFENARINIRTEKAVVNCSECGKDTEIEDYIFKCGSCGSGAVRVITGDRMYVESIDIES